MTLRLGGQPLPVIGTARVYVCGITPYDTTHLGHAATFVWTDVAARVLQHGGVNVEVCRNITDVDDHLLDQARAQGVSWRSLATQQTYRFEDDMQHLGVQRPTFEPQSHNYVGEVIALTAALLESGHAYERNGTVYFRGGGCHETAGLTRDEAIALAAERGGHPDDPAKDDPLDSAVWLRSEGDEPAWPSPWGDGRPGWHAECTAMALATLGPGIDVHGGGADLAFPHHAYEAAQAEAVTGVSPFARRWMRPGTVHIDGHKMAKSAGNLVFVHALLADWPPEAIRLLIIDRPWSEPWDWEPAKLDAAASRLDELQRSAGRPFHDETAQDAALAALEDDLDVPRALAIAGEAGGQALLEIGKLLGVLGTQARGD
jgi:cysteinyl-tRNA synthetase